jgi:VanZ family protein
MLTARRRRWAVFALVAVAGILGEVAQLLVSDRTFSVGDVVFSAAGAALELAVA